MRRMSFAWLLICASGALFGTTNTSLDAKGQTTSANKWVITATAVGPNIPVQVSGLTANTDYRLDTVRIQSNNASCTSVGSVYATPATLIYGPVTTDVSGNFTVYLSLAYNSGGAPGNGDVASLLCPDSGGGLRAGLQLLSLRVGPQSGGSTTTLTCSTLCVTTAACPAARQPTGALSGTPITCIVA